MVPEHEFLSHLLQREEAVTFFFFVFMRFSGLLVISPLLSNKAIGGMIRFFLAGYSAILLSMTLYPDYLGPAPRYIGWDKSQVGAINLVLTGIEEVFVGYVIGFSFNVVLEAMKVAGEVIDSMIGFSTAQFLDPISNTFQSSLGHLLLLFGASIILLLDLHHYFFILLAESFSIVPIGHAHISAAAIDNLSYITSLLWVFGIKFGAIPIVVLACGLVGIAFTVRVVPEMNLLLTGLPMRVLIGLYTIMMALGRILPIFEESFIQIYQLIEDLLHNLVQGNVQ
jgi:flagellar biosynthetic protein FliR